MATRALVPADTPTRRVTLEIEGVGIFDEWSSVEIVRDLKEFSGSFTATLRDATRSLAAFAFASPPPLYRLRPGPKVTVAIDQETVLVGWIDKVEPDVDDFHAEVTISGRDTAGDLVDCAAAPDGPGELKNVKLEEAVKRIAKPYGLTVRSEIDTGDPFERFPLELTETGLAAIEKVARQRHTLVTSDGVGGLVLTRTGGSRAPEDLRLPGNMKSSHAVYSHEKRHSRTVVRGQAEKAGGKRKGRAAPLDTTAEPLTPEARQASDGSATAREREGTAITGEASDPEITRHRPIVHLAKTQPGRQSAADEADFRMRTARAGAEQLVTRVKGFRAGPDGKLWKVNQLAFVDDRFQGIARDMLISRTRMTYDERGEETELTLTSPEAFDAKDVGGRRTNKRQPSGAKTKAAARPLDTTAEAL